MTDSNTPLRLILNSGDNEIMVRIAYEDVDERNRLKAARYQWLPVQKAWRKWYVPGPGQTRDEMLERVRALRDQLVTEHGYYLDQDFWVQRLVSPENLHIAVTSQGLPSSEQPDGAGRMWRPVGEKSGYRLYILEKVQ